MKYCIREITKLFGCFKASYGKVVLVPNKKAELCISHLGTLKALVWI